MVNFLRKNLSLKALFLALFAASLIGACGHHHDFFQSHDDCQACHFVSGVSHALVLAAAILIVLGSRRFLFSWSPVFHDVLFSHSLNSRSPPYFS